MSRSLPSRWIFWDSNSEGSVLQSSAESSSYAQASPKAAPKAKTALEASKVALRTLASATCLIPQGNALSVAIQGVLTVVETVEKTYENEETFKDLQNRIDPLIPIIDLLRQRGEEMPLKQILENLRNSFDEFGPVIEAVRNQAWISKDNTSSLNKSWEKLDRIINDAGFVLTVDIRNQQKLDAQRTVFFQLKPRRDATFNSDMRRHSGGRTCLESTRGDVMKEIHRWVESDAGGLFFLHGPAGSGKSTLSHTIAEYYSRPNKNLLAASFFFSRGYLSDSDILFQTIAFQLGHQHSVLRQEIANAIINDVTILDTKTKQLERLILDPVSKVSAFLPNRLVVVIDALDECDSDNAASDIIQLLATSLSSYTEPLPLRFLVTCRPEKHLYNLFMQPSSPNIYRLDLSNVDAMQDITLYITDELGGNLSRTDIDFLVQLSEGLFIAASTVVRFLKPSPTLRFSEVQSDGLSGLDNLYQHIMKRATRDTLPSEQETFRVVIGTIILAPAPLSIQALFDLLKLPREIKDLVLDMLNSLRSVIYVPDTPNGALHAFHHSSFHDFLVNSKYYKNPWFIDAPKYHVLLARRCLELIAEEGHSLFLPTEWPRT